MRRSRGIVAGSLALLAGCTVGPNYTTPAMDVPGPWTEATGEGAAPDRAWWAAFHDPELEALVGRAAGANTDVRAALARFREARQVVGDRRLSQAEKRGKLFHGVRLLGKEADDFQPARICEGAEEAEKLPGASLLLRHTRRILRVRRPG